MRSNDLLNLAAAARAGLGATVLPHYQARAFPGLVLADPGAAPPEREMWLVSHADVRRSPRVRAVADLIAAIVEEERGWLLSGNRQVGDGSP